MMVSILDHDSIEIIIKMARGVGLAGFFLAILSAQLHLSSHCVNSKVFDGGRWNYPIFCVGMMIAGLGFAIIPEHFFHEFPLYAFAWTVARMLQAVTIIQASAKQACSKQASYAVTGTIVMLSVLGEIAL